MGSGPSGTPRLDKGLPLNRADICGGTPALERAGYPPFLITLHAANGSKWFRWAGVQVDREPGNTRRVRERKRKRAR